MNNESTCCKGTEEANTTVANHRECAPSSAEPVWSATRREDGADLEVSLPGVRKEDLQLEVRGSRLVLEAKRFQAASDGRLIHGTAAPGTYRLELRLGGSLDGGALKANLESGLLRLSIPLVETARPKRIQIV